MQKHIIMAFISTLLLSGCIIVSDRDGYNESHSEWQERQKINRDFIADLEPGLSIESIKANLGKADYSEAYVLADQSVHVLRYRTQHTDSNGQTDIDETTPLVFIDNELIGWGERALAGYR